MTTPDTTTTCACALCGSRAGYSSTDGLCELCRAEAALDDLTDLTAYGGSFDRSAARVALRGVASARRPAVARVGL